jgi:hypothetical protein
MHPNQSWPPVITLWADAPVLGMLREQKRGVAGVGREGHTDILSIRFYIEIGIILLVYVILFCWVFCALAVFMCVEPQFSPFAQPSRLREAHLLA